MDSVHVEQLDKRVRSLQDILSGFATSNDLEELLMIIHRPGFTSPVELQFVNAMFDAMERSAAHTRQLHDALVAGSRAIAPESPAGTHEVESDPCLGLQNELGDLSRTDFPSEADYERARGILLAQLRDCEEQLGLPRTP
jgi:hypothetical protein